MIDNKYFLNKQVGIGGSSRVYEATDLEGNKVAIKAIRKDKNYKKSSATNMLKKEFEVLQKLSAHPNVVNVFDYNHSGQSEIGNKIEDVMYNVLEFAENGTLGQFVRHTKAIEEQIARLFISQIWDAIRFLHKQDHAHLDIKLENILLDKYYNIKVADLGSWWDVSATRGYATARRGTTKYMAPEVSNLKSKKKFDAKAADIYSLGVTFYLLLTGEYPKVHDLEKSVTDSKENFVYTWASDKEASDDWEMIDVSPTPSSLSRLSKEVRILLHSMLSPDPSERPDIFEILNSDWCCAPFEEGLLEEAYSEMEYRRRYIKRNFLSKGRL